MTPRRSAAAERLASRNLRAHSGAALKGLPASCPRPLHISSLAEHKVVDACCGALHSIVRRCATPAAPSRALTHALSCARQAVTAGGRIFWWGLLHEDPAVEDGAARDTSPPADAEPAAASSSSGAAEDPDGAAARDYHVDSDVRRAHAAEMASDAVPRSLVGMHGPEGGEGAAGAAGDEGEERAALAPHHRRNVAERAEESAVAYLTGSVASEAMEAGQRSMRLVRWPR